MPFVSFADGVFGDGDWARFSAAFTMSWLGFQADPASSASYTFNVDIGAFDADKSIVVIVWSVSAGLARTISGVTIDGNAATGIVTDASGVRQLAAYEAQVSTAGTVSIVVTFSDVMVRCGVAVYSFVNSSATAASNKASATTQVNTSTTALSASAFTPPTGSKTIVAAWAGTLAPSGGSVPITGATMTQRVDQVIEAGGAAWASLADTPDAGSSTTFTATAGVTTQMRILAFSWGP